MTKDLGMLKLKKLMSEYEFLSIDEQYRSELIESNRQDFMEKVSNLITDREPSPKNDKSSPKKEKESFDAGERTLSKIKKIYRDIAKKCHPDKTADPNLIDLYMQAELAHSENNIIELFRIAAQLNIKINLEDSDLSLILSIIDKKKKHIASLEQSYIWLWIHAPSEEFKDKIVSKFVEVHKNNL
jgi:hypothetical protein